MILLIYRNEDILPNQFNLFHPDHSFLALLVLTIGGSILFLLGLYRKIYRCKNEGFGNYILMLFALYDIMLGISLFVMRITGIGIYLIIFSNSFQVGTGTTTLHRKQPRVFALGMIVPRSGTGAD